ncbi:MAG: SAM-dependent methyltransferase, partial [Mariprofundaceae bacterium]|nr:SAM-dependent methyltransferase [Mariprofundaceae bacterium]
DVLQLSPGLCDITAHIDFSALKQAGESVGLQSYSYISQGAWLAHSPSIQQHLQHLAAHPTLESVAQISHAKRLMLPTGLGESFKLLIQGKGIEDTQCLTIASFNRCDTL